MTHQQRQILDHLARTCAERAWRVAQVLLRDTHEAWDAVQQAFVVAARKPDRVPRDDPWPWFARVVVLEARNLRRKRRPSVGGDREGGVVAADRDEPPVVMSRRETQVRLERALEALPAREREAIVLVHRVGMSHAEAARAAGRSRASITRSVRKGLERLGRGARGEPQLTARHLALLPLLDPPGGMSAAVTTWTQTAAAAALPSAGAALAAGSTTIMSSKTAFFVGLGLAASVGFVGGAATEGFGLFAPASARDASPADSALTARAPKSALPDGPELGGIPAGGTQAFALRAERDELAQRLAASEAEIARLRGAPASQEGPTFTFGAGGKLEGVREANWPRLADASGSVHDGMKRIRAAVESGEPVPKDAALQVQENVERMRVYEYRTLGKLPTAAKHNGELTHAISVTNLLAARLAAAGKPLAEDQVAAINKLGLSFEGELARVLEAAGPRVRRLLAEYRLKQRFMQDLYAALSAAQRQVVIDPDVHRIAGLDLYDPTLLLIHTSPIVAATTEDGVVSYLQALLTKKWGLDATQVERLTPLLDRWRERIRPLLQVTPKHRLKHYSADEAGKAGDATVVLVEGALRDLDLAPGVRAALEADPAIYVPRLVATP